MVRECIQEGKRIKPRFQTYQGGITMTDNKTTLGFRLVDAMSENIRSKENPDYSEINITLHINDELVLCDKTASEVFEYLSLNYPTRWWFDSQIEQTGSYFHMVTWKINIKEGW